jgi:hypothetical protein
VAGGSDCYSNRISTVFADEVTLPVLTVCFRDCHSKHLYFEEIYIPLLFGFCASIARTGPYGPDSSLRRHNVLSETQKLGSRCTCINRSGGAVSSHKRSPEGGSICRNYDGHVGCGRRGSGSTRSNEAARQLHNRRRWCTSTAGTATAETPLINGDSTG